jgi:NADH-quinone oxidoreductase subunit E
MKRFDLRHLKNDTAIIMFEIGDFENVQKSADVIYEAGYTLMNSIKFNEVDWTLVVKKVKPEPRELEEAEGSSDE